MMRYILLGLAGGALIAVALVFLAPASGADCRLEAAGSYDARGLAHGDWRVLRCDGSEMRGSMQHGRWHGPLTIRFRDGRVDIGAYAHGRKDGYWTHGQADGGSAAGSYRDGLKDGEWIHRNGNGEERARECWSAGRRVGNGPCPE